MQKTTAPSPQPRTKSLDSVGFLVLPCSPAPAPTHGFYVTFGIFFNPCSFLSKNHNQARVGIFCALSKTETKQNKIIHQDAITHFYKLFSHVNINCNLFCYCNLLDILIFRFFYSL